MLLHQVAVPVKDVDRAVEFYRSLLEDEPIAVFDPPGLAFFRLGETRLLLDAAAGEEAANVGGGLIYLRVPNVAEAVENLRSAGTEIHGEPHVIFDDTEGTFGAAGEVEWMAFIKDPDGNTIGLASRAPTDRSA
jgi:catechol 2,3-dioxygenase-like lactoylglutathione lyase family enzyme